jgi:hypothetical protein
MKDLQFIQRGIRSPFVYDYAVFVFNYTLFYIRDEGHYKSERKLAFLSDFVGSRVISIAELQGVDIIFLKFHVLLTNFLKILFFCGSIVSIIDRVISLWERILVNLVGL